MSHNVNFSELPDLAKSAQLLKFSVELPNKVKDGGIIGIAIVNGVNEGRIKSTVTMIKSMAKDNYNLMHEIIGEELLDEIINY